MSTPCSTAPVIDFHFLNVVDFDRCLQLQRRLVYEAQGSEQPRLLVLLAEHFDLLTVGRAGSRAHLRWTNEEMEREQLKVRWTGRAGGCLLHTPGQLAVYPIANLRALQCSAGTFLTRLRHGVRQAIESFQIPTSIRPGSFHIWAAGGMIASTGVTAEDDVTRHGLYLNVSPCMRRFQRIDAVPPDSVPAGERTTMSCLLAERRLPVRMTMVRAALVEALVEAFGATRHNLHTGHPWLRPVLLPGRENIVRAS